MGVTERVWAALTALVKLEDKVERHGANLKAHQEKIEGLTERVIRLEATLEIMIRASEHKRLN
jgi:hypothetical protein